MASEIESNRLWANRGFMIYLTGSSVSGLGDAFFTLGITWIIYATSHSLLQTALIQVVGHLDRILLGPFAGIWADRHDRTSILVVANVASGVIVGALAWVLGGANEHLTTELALVSIVILNTLRTVGLPAVQSVLPYVVGTRALTQACGWLSSINTTVGMLGSALAGLVIAAWGTPRALGLDAVSFGVAALAVILARFPKRVLRERPVGSLPHWGADIRDGWRVLRGQPVLRSMVWLAAFVNLASFAGPLFVGLIREQWHAGAAAFGIFEGATSLGAIVVSLCVAPLERRVDAGKVLAGGWMVDGLAVVGIATTHWALLGESLALVFGAGVTMAQVVLGPLYELLIPAEFRGRVWGINSAIATSVIPVSALIGGWLADRYGPGLMIGISGVWLAIAALLALGVPAVRGARIPTAAEAMTASNSP